MFQMKEQYKTQEKYLNELKIRNSPYREFKIMAIKILNGKLNG